MTYALTIAHSGPTIGEFIKDMLTGMLDSWRMTACVYINT